MRSSLAILIVILAVACGNNAGQEWDPCSKTSDCAGDLVCKEGVCTKPTARTSCLIDAQCPAGLKCLGGICSDGSEPQSECDADKPCPEGYACVKGSCVKGSPPEDECAEDEECDGGKVCEEGKCVEPAAPECTTDEECAPGTCDTEAGVCVGPSCESDEDCEEGTCDVEAGVCVVPEPECDEDGDCESGLCDTGAGLCIDEPTDCGEDAECNDDDECTADTCQGGKCKHVHVVTETCCLESADCVPSDACHNASCKDFHCVQAPAKDCCLEDAECDDGNPMTDDSCVENSCVNVGKACTFDADCDDENPCTIDSCKSQHCENVKTANPLCCVADEDCNDENPDTKDVCIDNECQFKTENCLHDTDCADSNPCTTEKCNQGICEYDPVKEAQCKCEADGDCVGKGNTCLLVQVGPLSLDTFCGPPVGTKLAGEQCKEDDDCKSGFCAQFEDGTICLGFCKTDMDCKGGTICGTVNINLTDDIVESFPACVIPPSECHGDKMCPDGESCMPALGDVPNTIEGLCAPTVGSKTAGSICSDDDECQSGICFNLFEKGINICWSTCETDADCLPGLYCYENLVYFIFDQDTPDKADDKYFALKSCALDIGSFNPCWADSDCPNNEFCNWYTDQTLTALEPHCISPKGNTGAGGSCTADSQCKSNTCAGSPPFFCLGLCKGNGDCNGGATCQQYDDFEINEKGDTVTVHLCLP
jgi:hypothetical protein